MNTTQFIRLLKDLEFGASGRPREISFYIDGKYVSEPKIRIHSSGDGVAGAEITLQISENKAYEEDEEDEEDEVIRDDYGRTFHEQDGDLSFEVFLAICFIGIIFLIYKIFL